MITRLITDRDVLLGKVSSPIVLDGQTLLTPAARDRAVEKGLVIVERGAPAGADPRTPVAGEGAVDNRPRHGSAVLGELPDGLYLVKVEGGRSTRVLPATGPGLLLPRAPGPAS